MVIKDGRIVLDCKACGQRSDVDLRQKLSSFILKNQPKKGKKDKASKRSRRDKEQNKENGEVKENGRGSPGESGSDPGETENGDVALEAGSDDELTRRIAAEAKDIDQSEDVKDDEWAVDVSEEAVKQRAKELTHDLKRALVVADDEDDEGEGENGANGAGGSSAYDQLGSWILDEAREKKGGVGEVGDVEIYIKAKELGIETKHRTLTVLAQTLFDDDIVKQIPKRASMLKKVSLSIFGLLSSHIYPLRRPMTKTKLTEYIKDDYNRSPSTCSARRHRTLRRRSPPQFVKHYPGYPHGILPRRTRDRGSLETMGFQSEQEIRRCWDEQEGAEIGREVL